MNFTRTIGAMTLLAATALGSCQKYEEGPAVSLTPREDRVANTWVIAYAEENGENVSSDFDQYELYLKTDRDATLTASYTAFGTDFNTTTNGTWNFTNDDENIRFDYEDDDQDNEFRILRLKSDELWLQDIDQDLELHLLPK
jgi:hypothetical protein